MRFPRKLGPIDYDKTESLLLEAVERGINYYDTAYVYAGCEETLGRVFQRNNLRDRVFLATKLPLGRCRQSSDFDDIFEDQLKNLKTDHVDYYLMHNLSDIEQWNRLCSIGVLEWISRQKDSGRIRQIGFSFHGEPSAFLSLLDAYSWDFCQIQYNYMNTNYQAGTTGLMRAAELGLPVIIMEPLLGGSLANKLPNKARKILSDAEPAASPAQWALRWLWDIAGVTVVLSGMNEKRQLDENISTAEFSVPNMLTDAEREVLQRVSVSINGARKVPCTGCNYCMPCPRRVNIPVCFAAYNMSYAIGYINGFFQYTAGTGVTDPMKTYSASHCKKCGKCEKLCPQHIPIIRFLEMTKRRMEPFWFKPLVSLVKILR